MAGTFSSQHQLRLLQLSGNPIEHLPAGCLSGLTELSVLSLAYVSSDEVRVDDETFDDVAQSLARLELDSSPGLLRALLASDAILVRLSGVGDLSARSSDLVSVRTDLSLFLPSAAVRLSSSRWNCDRSLIWLRDWLKEAGHAATSPSAKAAASDIAQENRCATPRSLAGRTLFSLSDDEFDASTVAPDHQPFSYPPTVTHFVDKSTSVKVDSRISSTSPDQRRSGHLRRSGELAQSHAIYGNFTTQQNVELEEKLPSYRRIDHDDVDIRSSTVRAHTQNFENPVQFGAASSTNANQLPTTGRTSTGASTLIAAAATVGVTVVLVVIILTVICRLLRVQKPAPSPTNVDQDTYCKNVIKQCQRNETLYFMSTSATSNGAHLSAPTSRTRLDLAMPSATVADAAKSVGEITSLLLATNGRDVVDRSASAGEPLRLYKWEDF